MIHISLSPNVRREDVRLAIRLLLTPWRWLKGTAVARLETTCRERFDAPHTFAISSGRAALHSILKAAGIGAHDEVLLQAFTCNAVSNPILAIGARPVYVDIEEETYNINCKDLEIEITPRSRAIIIQHTFGKPAPIERVLEIARRHNLLVIEDCAHALGAAHSGKRLGTFGDAAFLSFGRDKVISSVFGGMIITKNQESAQEIEKITQSLKFPSRFWVVQQLLHPILTKTLILPLYNSFGLGKALLFLLQGLGVLSKAVLFQEKQGQFSPRFLVKMPNALAELALAQFQELTAFNTHRKEIARFYSHELRRLPVRLPARDEECTWLRYPVRTTRARDMLQAAKRSDIVLGDWYQGPVDPPDTALEAVGYERGSCPVAERISREIVNLPTHPTMSQRDAERVVIFLRKFFS